MDLLILHILASKTKQTTVYTYTNDCGISVLYTYSYHSRQWFNIHIHHVRIQFNFQRDKCSRVTVFCCCSPAGPSSWSTSESADHNEHTDSAPTHKCSHNFMHTKNTNNSKTSVSPDAPIQCLQTLPTILPALSQ